jgi:hypothetical protein
MINPRAILKRTTRPYFLGLFIAFVLINSSVLFYNRTLLPIAPSSMVVPERPFRYKGPYLDWTTTVDPFGSMNVCYAFDAYTAHCLKKGIVPYWDPYQGLGQPFLASGLSAVLYPVNWLHLVLPPAWWDVVFLLNWLLGALFLFAYLRLINLEPEAALVGACAVFACGAIQVYLPLREVPAVAAWWPLLLYAVERTCREPAWRWRHVVLAIAIFCSVAGGQPEVTFISLIAAAGYATLRIVWERKRALALIARLVPGTAAGLLLSAPHWLNFATYAFNAFSAHVPGCRNGAIHLNFQAVASYIFPYFYGRVHTTPFSELTGFYWVYSPGWAAPLCCFLALASIGSFRQKPKLTLAFLGLVTIIVLAKIFGVPGINWLGTLPYFELIVFPRYASFLPGLGLAALAAFGISFLRQAGHRTWLFWIIVWVFVACAVFMLGLLSIWSSLSKSASGSEAWQIFYIFGLGGLAWALIQPAGLWWIKYRRPTDSLPLYATAAFGMLLHAIAFAPRGYSDKIYAAFSALGLGAFVLFVLFMGFCPGRRAALVAGCLGASVLISLPILAAALGRHGLNSRYNPLTAPPFIPELVGLQEGGLYRSYSLDPMPYPDFAAPFELASLDNLNAICPDGTARFALDYLDFGLSGIMFTGNRSVGAVYGTALDQIKKNKRYYDLVAVKYLVTSGPSLGSYVYDTHEAIPGLPHPVPIAAPLTATFISSVDQFSSVQVPIGTYGRQNPGILDLAIADQSGRLIESSQIPAAELQDNQYAEFPFSNIRGVQGQTLRLLLTFKPTSKESIVAAYVPLDISTAGFAFRVPTPQGIFRAIYRDSETSAVFWENPDATPRVFLAPEIKPASSGREALSLLKDIPDPTRLVVVESEAALQSDPDPTKPAGTLHEFHVSPNGVRIKYSANLPGILTVVDSFSDGWRAQVNGQDAPVLRVDGVFRGVRIESTGEVDVRFWYRPPRWNLSLSLAGLGLLILLGAVLAGRKRHSPSLQSQ